ncbi:hypothetical protein TanjilG_22668 [Lupinus angustifolius]|uniref:Uncharacterized protein n=1 Tax=Lupinus angustifolius TaxID=3871 RepID=A0A1J7GM79_LUPAN|nr:hypothetical protein TanjilG_22668 [Lupinus angustifolius]
MQQKHYDMHQNDEEHEHKIEQHELRIGRQHRDGKLEGRHHKLEEYGPLVKYGDEGSLTKACIDDHALIELYRQIHQPWSNFLTEIHQNKTRHATLIHEYKARHDLDQIGRIMMHQYFSQVLLVQ